MSRHQLWARLAWKEVREDWAVVLACAVSPVLLCRFGDASCSAGWFIVQALIVLWAVQKAGRARLGNDVFETRLPVNPVQQWFVQFALPLTAAAGMGVIFAASSGTLYASGFGYSPSVVMATDIATTFALCYLIAAAISYWGAITLGIARLLFSGLISPFEVTAAPPADAVGFAITTVVALSAGSFVFSALLRANPRQVRQALSLMAVLGVMFVPSAVSFVRNPSFDTTAISDIRMLDVWNLWSGGDDWSEYSTQTQLVIESEQELLFVVMRMTSNGEIVQVRDRQENVLASTEVRGTVCLIGHSGGERIFIARQLPKSKTVEILDWRPRSDRLTSLAQVSLRADALANVKMGPINPEGTYALMKHGSKVGLGTDIWLLGLRENTAWLVIDNCSFNYDEAVWTDQKAVLSGKGGLATIDLATARAQVFGWSGRARK